LNVNEFNYIFTELLSKEKSNLLSKKGADKEFFHIFAAVL